ncbi:hypothetical protein SSX86_027780 [Deinandra increscens subsp. villosa]|uniref:Uncharacterized protein n=1 Tax=Deinandra increscens subsp. villosa TaxID=3103831 RepID=A0AAP0C6G7_9ASTR
MADSVCNIMTIEQPANQRLRCLLGEQVKDPNKSTAVVSKRSKRGSPGQKMQRRTPKKAVRTPVVINEVTERLMWFVLNELKGTDMKLVIQKNLYYSDTRKCYNRLSMPMNQLETRDFLTADEKRIVMGKNREESVIEVPLLGPTLEMYQDRMKLTMWRMQTSLSYVLKTRWFEFWSKYKECLKEGVKIQVWSFRIDEQLCFAVACVEEPDGKDDVA